MHRPAPCPLLLLATGVGALALVAGVTPGAAKVGNTLADGQTVYVAANTVRASCDIRAAQESFSD